MSEHYEVGIENADGMEYSEFAAESTARRNYRWAVDKLRPGERATLTKVILLDAAEGADEPH
jgi:hypothetical protein